MVRTLLINFALAIAFMTLAYGVALRRRRLDTVDVAWGLGFMILAWSSWLQHHNARSLLIAILVTVWGGRLALHIGRRSLASTTDDRRYTELAEGWKGNRWARAYFSIYLVQGVLVWVVGLPVSLTVRHGLGGLGWLSVVGTAIWLAGFTFETAADRQLRNFLAQPDHPKNMEEGLWRYSRHPNYFGELTQWWGIAIISLQVSWGWLGPLGPLTLTYLIVFVSGIPPIERKRAKDPAYRDYQKRTSPLIPLRPKGNA